MAEALNTPEPAAFGVARSLSGRRWRLRQPDAAAVRALQQDALLPPVLAQLLALRGVPAAEAAAYLAPTLKALLPDPDTLKDMERAVARVAAALDAGEPIAVFGDYDVDGSVSSALLADFLAALGHAPRIYIPDRMKEGYGPNPAAMQALAAEGARLVIAVDCGAAADAANKAARIFRALRTILAKPFDPQSEIDAVSTEAAFGKKNGDLRGKRRFAEGTGIEDHPRQPYRQS